MQLDRFVGEDLEAVSAAHSTYLRSKAKCDVARNAFLSLPKWVDAGEREERKEELEDAKHTVDAARSRCDRSSPNPRESICTGAKGSLSLSRAHQDECSTTVGRW